jgi:hypothetical protein
MMVMGDKRPRGVMWRTVVTVIAGLGWLVWLLLWWAFWSDDYTIAQKFAVSIMSLMVAGGIAGAIWIPFSMRYGDDKDQWREPGFTWRIMVSMAVFIGLAIFVVYMLFFPWSGFDWCQSIVIIIVILIVGAAMMAPLWIRWGRRKVETELDEVAEEISESIEEAIEEAYEREHSKVHGRDDDDDDNDDD